MALKIGRRNWHLIVMGSGGETYGLALFSDPDALAQMMRTSERADGTAVSMAVTFDRKADVPKKLQRFVSDRKLPLANETAYPLAIKTIGSRPVALAAADVDAFVAALEATTRFVERHGDVLKRVMGYAWPGKPIRERFEVRGLGKVAVLYPDPDV